MNGQKMGSFETNVISLLRVQGPSNELTMVRLVLDIRIPQKLLSPPICFDLRPAAPPVIQLTSITIQGRSCVLIQVNRPNGHLMHQHHDHDRSGEPEPVQHESKTPQRDANMTNIFVIWRKATPAIDMIHDGWWPTERGGYPTLLCEWHWMDEDGHSTTHQIILVCRMLWK